MNGWHAVSAFSAANGFSIAASTLHIFLDVSALLMERCCESTKNLHKAGAYFFLYFAIHFVVLISSLNSNFDYAYEIPRGERTLFSVLFCFCFCFFGRNKQLQWYGDERNGNKVTYFIFNLMVQITIAAWFARTHQ